MKCSEISGHVHLPQHFERQRLTLLSGHGVKTPTLAALIESIESSITVRAPSTIEAVNSKSTTFPLVPLPLAAPFAAKYPDCLIRGSVQRLVILGADLGL